MNNAIKFAKEIYRKMTAIELSNSEDLKADYKKSIKRDYEDLKFYCECKNISINDVWLKVIQGDKNVRIYKQRNKSNKNRRNHT